MPKSNNLIQSCSTDIFLKINTNMHSAPITCLATDKHESLIFTASEDKTIKIWELNTFNLIKTLRIPIKEGYSGKIFSIALSPDNRYIACGGWTTFDNSYFYVYIFDMQIDDIITTILEIPDCISFLSYSNDGNYLVICALNNGLRVYKNNDNKYELIFQDLDYGYSSYCAKFDKENFLVTCSLDGYVRIFNVQESKLIQKKKISENGQPFSFSFSSDYSKICVGYVDNNRIDLFTYPDFYSYASLYDITMMHGNLAFVSFSPDKNSVIAGGNSYKKLNNDYYYFIKKWNFEENSFDEIPIAKNTITGLVYLSSEKFLCTSAEPSICLYDNINKKLQRKYSEIVDFRDNLENFLISYDGKRVCFSFESEKECDHFFDISSLELQSIEATNYIHLMHRPKIESESIKILNWKNNHQPIFNSKKLELIKDDLSRCLSIMNDDSGFVLGTDWGLFFYDSESKIKWFTQTSSPTCVVNISKNCNLLVAAFLDGTIKWYRISDGKLLLTLFPNKDKKRWVLWTPKGYYVASPGGEDLFGWHVNKGLDKTPEFYPASRFRDQFYRPDVIEKILETFDEDKALEIANKESSIETKARKITQILPPIVKILEPKDGDKIDSEELRVRYLVKNESSGNRSIKVLIDGRPFLQVERGIPVSEGPSGVVEELAIVVPKKDFELGLIASNIHSSSVPHTIKLFWAGENREHFRKPELYVVAIGVSNYANSSLNLKYAHKDAQDFIDVLMGQRERFYSNIKYRLLINQDATKDNILEALEWLQSSVRKDDVAMLFFAGHGKSDSVGIYYFLPYDGELESLKRTGISFSEIRNTVSTIQAKVILFIDTCHAGGVLGGKRLVKGLTRMINEFSSPESGVIVFASAGDNQYSYEAPLWNNGAFTKALVEILSGESLKLPEGELTVFLLSYYLSKRVRELTNNNQIPVVMIPQIIPDFPLAAVV